MPDSVPAAPKIYKSQGSKHSKAEHVLDLPCPPEHHSRSTSTSVNLGPALNRATSPSSSEYSCDSDTAPPLRATGKSGKTLKHARRASALSDVGTDRRRLAIVQMEALPEGRSKSASEDGHNSRFRKTTEPNLAGLALVAPPDASPLTYTHLSPPGTATDTEYTKAVSRKTRSKQRPWTAHKSSSQLSLSNYQSRPRSQSTNKDEQRDRPTSSNTASIPPLNLCPSTSTSSVNLHSPSVDQQIVTPPIGEMKDIHTPVAPPVIVNLESGRPLNITKARTMTNNNPVPPIPPHSPTDSSGTRGGVGVPYIHYQPGLHAAAGPLPPPPRATFAIDPSNPPPPRPPRVSSPQVPRSRGDIEAVRQALQLPPSVSAALASRPSPGSSSRSPPNSNPKSNVPPLPESSPTIEEVLEIVETKSSHRREGAFTPTPDLAKEEMIPSPLASQKSGQATSPGSMETDGSEERGSINTHGTFASNSDGGVVMVTPPPRTNSLRTPINEDEPPAHVRRDLTPSPEPSANRSLSPDSAQTPSPPPKSFRNSLTTSLKRFSALPRTPSVSSKSGNRSSIGTVRTSRTPSPPYQNPQPVSAPPRTRPKTITLNPPALFCHEVHSIKSASERSSIYAQKINELYNCDTGLVMWLSEARHRGTNNASSTPNNVPPSPSTDPFTPQRRHISGSSTMTDATFPRRPDATTATDLTNAHRNITPPSSQPPVLPYPSLASQQRLPHPLNASSNSPLSSIRSLAPSTPTGTLKGALFATLGRRSSASGRREKPGITALTPTNSQNGGSSGRVPHPPLKQQPLPRPVNVTTSPSVPGGPRAPPSRVKRSQTLMTTPAPFSTKPEAERLERAPTQNFATDYVIDIKPDPEFTHQVDRLADLLPHADRDILAAYLRRAGQDILAIGQYLEDEKNGTIHTD